MERREFLKWAGVGSFSMLAPGVMGALTQPAAGGAGAWDRVLVLVELKGGNDGLNMIVPYASPDYYALRPRLAVARERVLQLSPQLGLHPNLNKLMEGWQSNQMAIALGVGYPNPNRSHFRSIEIWETGSNADEYRSEGWVAQVFAQHHPPAALAADAVVIGQGETGPVAGPGMRTISMRTPDEFVRRAQRVAPGQAGGGGAAMGHILGVQQQIVDSAGSISDRIKQGPELKTEFPNSAFGRELRTAAQLLAARVPLAVVKVSIGGFDTHANQTNTHERLMRELGDGLAAFRTAMVETGLWNQTLVMTYSEFGRRAAENGSGGTDHGTAAPHILMGGKVRGGFYGEQPALNQLEGGDLKHTLDYRSLYATVSQEWWGLQAEGGAGIKPLRCIV